MTQEEKGLLPPVEKVKKVFTKGPFKPFKSMLPKAGEEAKDAVPVKPLVEENPALEADVFSSEKFEDLPINNKLKQILKENKFETLTSVQKNSIPIILKS
jgi:hypothetical protein